MVATGKWKSMTAPVDTIKATIEPGSRGMNFGISRITARETIASATVAWIKRAEMHAQDLHAREEFARHMVDLQAEEIFDLRGRDQQRNAVGKSDDDGAGDELDRVSQTRESEHQQDHARHHRDHQQSVESMFGDDARHDDDESAGGSADLNPRTAQRRNDEPADDCGVDPGLWRDARSDAERHRQRECHQADREARDEIGQKGPYANIPAGIRAAAASILPTEYSFSLRPDPLLRAC